MTKPIRIQLSRRKGWRLADAAGNGLPSVKVDRTTKWGNPYVVGPATAEYPNYAVIATHHDDAPVGFLKTAPEAIALAVDRFRRWAYKQEQGDFRAKVRRDLPGKNLGCWCKPGTPCHAEVLLEIANAPEKG